MRRTILAGVTLAALVAAGCGAAATPTPTAAPTTAATPTPATSSAPIPLCASAAAGAAADVDVQIVDFAYDPEPIQASVGEIIVWTNGDGAPHSATLDVGECTTETLESGESGGLTFSEPGTYTYHCRVHPGQMADYTIEVSG